MPDFPGVLHRPQTLILSTVGATSALGDVCSPVNTVGGAGAWSAANRAVYVPVVLEVPAIAYQMVFIVGAQAGNFDVGIYDDLGNRLVSLGSTAVPAAGVGIADITNTTLTPGVYFLAMNCSTVTTLTINRVNPGSNALQLCGVQFQDVGATALPDPATFSTPTGFGIAPVLSVSLTTVM